MSLPKVSKFGALTGMDMRVIREALKLDVSSDRAVLAVSERIVKRKMDDVTGKTKLETAAYIESIKARIANKETLLERISR